MVVEVLKNPRPPFGRLSLRPEELDLFDKFLAIVASNSTLSSKQSKAALRLCTETTEAEGRLNKLHSTHRWNLPVFHLVHELKIDKK